MKTRHLFAAVTLVPAMLGAQAPGPVSLQPADAAIDSFGCAGSARELADGRVLMACGGRTHVVDFDSGTGALIPSLTAFRLTPLAGDSTLAVAYSTWGFLDGTRVLGMLAVDNPVVTAAKDLRGADAFGHVLAVVGGQPASDSANVFLIDRVTGMQRLITRVWESTPAMANVPAPTFVVYEQPVLMLDGWIAVVRANPYRIDWRAPDGQWTLGVPLPIPPVPMDAREVAAYWARYQTRPLQFADNPRWVVPFTYPEPMATPEGDVLVRRTPTADYPGPRYDQVDRTGHLMREILLPEHATIAGVGPRSVYVIVPAQPRRIQLERHPWP